MRIISAILLFWVTCSLSVSYAGTMGTVENSGWTEQEQEVFRLLAHTGTDEEVKAAYRNLAVVRISHEADALKEKQTVIYWSNRASIFIFVLVHAVLIFGTFAAFKEFREASRLRSEKPEQHEVQISLEGIALKTSLHGTLLFGVCLGLYFLFLKYVFPINVV